MTGMYALCMGVHPCECVRLSCATAQWPFLPALFKPKLHGAAYGKGIYLSPISSISFGYSGRKRFLRPAPPPPRLFFFKFFHRVDCVRSVFVTWPDYHCGILHFHLWELFMQTLLSCSVLCVHIWGAGALGLLSELACHVPYHTLCCDCAKLGCQWICVCHFVPCWLLYILFFSWGGAVQPC